MFLTSKDGPHAKRVNYVNKMYVFLGSNNIFLSGIPIIAEEGCIFMYDEYAAFRLILTGDSMQQYTFKCRLNQTTAREGCISQGV